MIPIIDIDLQQQTCYRATYYSYVHSYVASYVLAECLQTSKPAITKISLFAYQYKK